MNVTKPTVTLPNKKIRKYIDLYMKEEVENGRDPLDLSLKDTIEVYLHIIRSII